MTEDTHKDVATSDDKVRLRALNERVTKKTKRLMLKKRMYRASHSLSNDPNDF